MQINVREKYFIFLTQGTELELEKHCYKDIKKKKM